MELVHSVRKPAVKKDEAFIVGCYENGKFDAAVSELLEKEGINREVLKTFSFKGKIGDVAAVPGSKGHLFIFTGLGKKSELNREAVRKAIGVAIKEAKTKKVKRVAAVMFDFGKKSDGFAAAFAEGILLSAYSFEKYKSEKKEIEAVTVYGAKEFKEEFSYGKVLAEAANFTRDIVNEPGNVVTPETLAEIAKDLASEYGFKCKIFKEKDLEKKKMIGILTVGKGSKNPPRFIHLTYKPENPVKKFVLVGKGVTFDSGGLNIKPEQFMKKMKMDKAGACAVLGIMKAVGELKPDVEVHALIPAVENMPDGKAYRPDDILVYKNGKSVEIHSTDAEGRLILADALIYGSDLNPDIMVDMATLTGACVVALGHYTSGLFTADDRFAQTLLSLSQESGEKMWRLPLDEDLEEEIKGTQSDIQNVGKSRYGGAITAALFLKNFVGENVKTWAHIDIAGPAFVEKDWKYYGYGATGQPVRTLAELIKDLK
ncbi:MULTISPECIES: leucyl aminopeptidase [unclassified Desulfurobacterium]|uniref:leucyl aminopeptidase n=1 Tax=Desulfurobacterium sp. TC5-1 TaxID=1158318 RepID=UPI0003B3363D|nr:leucyl aminopeptidase [Desulfurobacterium sp. TC5-1]